MPARAPASAGWVRHLDSARPLGLRRGRSFVPSDPSSVRPGLRRHVEQQRELRPMRARLRVNHGVLELELRLDAGRLPSRGCRVPCEDVLRTSHRSLQPRVYEQYGVRRSRVLRPARAPVPLYPGPNAMRRAVPRVHAASERREHVQPGGCLRFSLRFGVPPLRRRLRLELSHLVWRGVYGVRGAAWRGRDLRSDGVRCAMQHSGSACLRRCLRRMPKRWGSAHRVSGQRMRRSKLHVRVSAPKWALRASVGRGKIGDESQLVTVVGAQRIWGLRPRLGR